MRTAGHYPGASGPAGRRADGGGGPDDQEQAHALLTWRLPPLPASTVWGLLDLTGRWPLLLRLVNSILQDADRLGQNVNDRARDLIQRLALGGSTAADALVPGSQSLDVNVPAERARAARVTIEASSSRLASDDDRARLLELGVFAEDESVPISLAQQLWAATGGVDAAGGARLCHDLDRLSLVSVSRTAQGPAVITLHDVIRSYLRAELGEASIRTVNQTLVDALAATLPTEAPLVDGAPPGPAWWTLPTNERYLWDNLAYHLAQADRPGQFDATVTDLRWVVARLLRSGPVAPVADLDHATTPPRHVAGTAADPDRPPAHPHQPPIGTRPHPAQPAARRPRLVPRGVTPAGHHGRTPPGQPLPDRPDPAHRRTLTGHTSGVYAVAIAPDGTWLAPASGDKTVRLWDAATGRMRTTLTGHTDAVNAVAIAPDGTWLATASNDQTVRLWHAATGPDTGHPHPHRRRARGGGRPGRHLAGYRRQ